MISSIRFEEHIDPEQTITIPQPKPVSLVERLLGMQVAASAGEAMVLIAIIVACLIGASIYFLIAAVPHDSFSILTPFE